MRWIVASHNAGKVKEIKTLLGPLGVEPVSAGALGLPVPDETEDSFEGNAALKAHAAAKGAQLPALADDSGLCVAALGGAPGVWSADWAELENGGPRDFGRAISKVEAALANQDDPDRSAHFVCVLALAFPDGALETYRGEVYGRLSCPPRGGNGFGYDPIFVPEGQTLTFGEMEPARKHAMSHRARAFKALLDQRFPGHAEVGARSGDAGAVHGG